MMIPLSSCNIYMFIILVKQLVCSSFKVYIELLGLHNQDGLLMPAFDIFVNNPHRAILALVYVFLQFIL